MASIDKELLAEYGDLLARYGGTGSLTFAKTTVECDFQAGQLRDGTTLLLCRTDPNIEPALDEVPTNFTGVTEEGCLVRGATIAERYFLPESVGEGRWATYILSRLAVEPPPQGRTPSVLHFSITNCALTKSVVLDLSIEGGNHRITVSPLVDQEPGSRLRAMRGVEVTAEAFLVPAPTEAIAFDVLREVCYSLSVALGTRVEWISYEGRTAAGDLVRTVHGTRVTKAFTPIPLFRPTDHESIETFLKAAPRAFRENQDLLLGGAVVEAWLDARQEQDFLELRGAKAVVVAEMLASLYQRNAASDETGWVVDRAEFDNKIAPALENAAREALSSLVPAQTLDALVNRNKLIGLNRRSFRYLLQKMAAQVEAPISADEILLFTNSRNCLLHQGRFSCDVESDSERKSLHESPWKEYCFLLNLVDRLLLRVFQYRGTYIDWSRHGTSDFPSGTL